MTGGITVGEICFFDADGDWLEGDELAICIAQLSQSSVDQIQANAARPDHVATVRAILAPNTNPGLASTLKNGTPSVLLCPEYAFGLDDFDALDTAVRGWTSPLIQICGFGAVDGSVLNAWLAEGVEGTSRIAGWSENDGPAPDRTYNGGWVWIHKPGVSTRCIVYLKNFPEARHEVCLLERFDVGRDMIAIRCNDLVIFPQICADLICATNACPVDRLRQWIEAQGKQKPRILVAASLLQADPSHEIWQSAIDKVCAVSPSIILALANVAIDKLKNNELEDRWRSLSGVFTSKASYRSEQAPLSPARNLGTHATLSGLLVRDTAPCAVTGLVRWEYGADHGRHLWRALAWWRVSTVGAISNSDQLCTRHAYELERFARLRKFGAHERSGADAMTSVREHIASGEPPIAKSLIHSLIERIATDAEDAAPDALREQPTLSPSMVALGLVKNGTNLDWNVQSAGDGQLREPEGSKEFRVWFPPDSYPREIEIALGSIAQSPGLGSELIVFAKSGLGSVRGQRIVPNARSRITQPVATPGRSAVGLKPRPITLLPGSDVEELATCNDHAQLVAGMNALLNSLPSEEAAPQS